MHSYEENTGRGITGKLELRQGCEFFERCCTRTATPFSGGFSCIDIQTKSK